MNRIATTTAAAAAALALLSGCATIFNGKTQAISIQSEPTGADFTITNVAGEQVHRGVTPVTLTLNRGASYFRPETYTITFTKAGLPTREVVVSGSMSGWYIGNILFGGLIGMLAVDPVTGAMYVFPDTISASLAPPAADAPASAPAAAPAKTSGTRHLTVVSTASLSPEQMKQARLLAAAP